MKKLIKQLMKGRVVLIEKDKKNPFEEGWTLDEELYERVEGGEWINKKNGEPYRVKGEIYKKEPTNYSFNDPKVQQHLSNGGNIGYLCGSNKIYVFDLDKIELLKEFEEIIGETLTIGTTHGYHLYFEYDRELYKFVFEKAGVHLGELLGIGQQVLIPPSVHPSGKEYVVLKDIPIIKLSEEKLNLIKEKFSDTKIEIKSPDWSSYNNTLGDKLPITSLVDMTKLKRYGQEFYGVHEIHGSTTGMNFFINPMKNLWHCFRHNSGGDSLAYLSIKEGICKCENFAKNGKRLKGEDFIKTLETATAKYNLVLDEIKNIDTQIPNSLSYNFRILSVKELCEMDIPLPKWLVNMWIPDEGLVILAGKSASMKSFLVTVMAICSMYEKNFLGKFKAEKVTWLYLDDDNPLGTAKDRILKVLKGMDSEPPFDFKYISQSGLKIDREEDVKVLSKIITELNAKVVVLDSLTRFLADTNENDANAINAVLNNLRRFSSLHKVTFLIIHHLRKSSTDKRVGDPDDMIRGSSDIINACDVGIIISRKDKSSPFIHVKQIKNRLERELEPFVIVVNETLTKDGLSFEFSCDAAQEKTIESRAADEILEWLRKEKQWNNPEDKTFKTAEVIERFNVYFHPDSERNRKIISGALLSLLVREKLMKTSAKGYYKYVELIEPKDIEGEGEKDE